ncbi:septum formation family protein [Streptomyces sp. NPDC019890]|uniref:septum formation family protein n=1 Tax=Streptomyces sp. NPDC019890 TaxID=3365064 RepID=UPI0038508942
MAPPDAQPPEEPRQEPPYWPWPGEQVPYRRAEHPTVDAHFTEDSPPPRGPRRRWLPVGAVLVAVAGITTAALLFTQSGQPGPDDSAGVSAGILDEPGDDITPTTSEPQETTSEPYEPIDPPDSSSPEEPSPTEDDEPSPTETQEVYVDDLSVGDCVDSASSTNFYVIVPCDGEHERQTLDLATLEDRAEYPGEDVVAEEADGLCWDAYYLASRDWPAEDEELLTYGKVTPGRSTWANGDRTVICLLKTIDGSALQEDWLGRSG